MLLPRNGTTAAEVSKRLHMPPRNTQRCLAALERKGLITHSPEQVRRYFAAPPDIAVEALMARRQSEAPRGHHGIARIAKTADGARHAEERIVEIPSREAAVQLFLQVMQSAEREILCLERLPGLVSAYDRPDDVQLQRLAKGKCGSRTITDSSLLNVPGTLNRLRIATRAGEQYRIFPSLPFKLVVTDHRIGIIP